jgi:hypothetical protein
MPWTVRAIRSGNERDGVGRRLDVRPRFPVLRLGQEPTVWSGGMGEERTGPEWCEHRRCGGKGLREVSPQAVRRARTLLRIGRASWRVCESCADLLERERRNWSRGGGPVKRTRIPVPRIDGALTPRPAPMAAPSEKEPKPRKAGKRPMVRTSGSLARDEKAETKASNRRAAKLRREARRPASRGPAISGTKATRDAAKRKRRAEWLAEHSD